MAPPIRWPATAASLAIALVCAAPTCQDTNPEFEGAGGSGGATGATADTQADGLTTLADGGSTQSTGEVDSEGDTATTTQSGGSTSTTGMTTSSTDTGASTSADSDTGCPGLICPGDGCIDPQTDPDNCGRCGNKCNPAQEMCTGGDCVDN